MASLHRLTEGAALSEWLGALRAGPGSTVHELQQARRDVQLAAEAAPARVVSVRRAPLSGLDPLAPAWTQVMRPSARRGPFVNDAGEAFWLDTFELPQLVSVYAAVAPGAPPQLLARLPLSHRIALGARRRVGSGTLWLASRLLVPGRPADEFVGLRIRGGTARLEPVAASTHNSVTLGPGWQIGLNLQPESPAAPAAADGPGGDAADAVVELPASLGLVLGAGAAPEIGYAAAQASAYGSSIALRRKQAAPFHDALSNTIVLPADASAGRFDLAALRSTLWQAEGGAIDAAGWAWPVVVSAPASLGEAAGAGALWLRFAGAQAVRWTGLPQRARLPRAALGLAPGSLAWWGTVAPEAVVHALRLWDETDPDPPPESRVELHSQAGSTVLHLSVPGAESVLFAGRAVGHLDRPLQADGGRVALRLPTAWLALIDLPTERRATVLGLDPGAAQAPHIAFALRTAFAKVRPPGWLLASGPLDGADRLAQGQLWLRCALRTLLPTLPDPYAANVDFDRREDSDRGTLVARIDWPDPASPVLGFSVEGRSVAPPAEPVGFALAHVAPRLPGGQVLLDVSSRADQFGVLIPAGASSVALQGLDVVAHAGEVGVLTLPPISWEPMLTKAPQGGGDIPLPPPPHDGGPAILNADAADLQPVEPAALLASFHAAIQQRRHFVARLPLPFGLIAQIQTRRGAEGPEAALLAAGGRVFFNRPAFDGDLAGGTQLAVQGAPSPGDTVPPPATWIDPLLPGYVELADSVAENRYATGVLSQNIITRFRGDFGETSKSGPVSTGARRRGWCSSTRSTPSRRPMPSRARRHPAGSSSRCCASSPRPTAPRRRARLRSACRSRCRRARRPDWWPPAWRSRPMCTTRPMRAARRAGACCGSSSTRRWRTRTTRCSRGCSPTGRTRCCPARSRTSCCRCPTCRAGRRAGSTWSNRCCPRRRRRRRWRSIPSRCA